MLSFIPQDLIYLIIVTSLSFLIGLELKSYRESKNVQKTHIGSARTYTFIGIAGFVFFKINLYFYIAGFLSLTLLYAIHYYYKTIHDRTSIVSYLVMSIVYSFGALIEAYNNVWLVAFLFVLVVFILNYKSHTQNFLNEINEKEIETLGKFLLLSAVILPILPDTEIKYINISPFKIWLVVVIISAISYGSYLAQKFIFKNKGYLLTGIFGGLYSSTATTVVLSKKALSIKAKGDILSIINSSIIVATSMMYLRLLVIAVIFNFQVAKAISLPLILFAAAGIVISFALYKKQTASNVPIDDRNPLELGTAFVFAFLFVAMMAITHYVTAHFGNVGLKILSFIIGFTDIDPFVLSLMTGKFHITLNAISAAIVIAAGSNNILKAIYALIFSKKIAKTAAIWLFVLGILTIAYGLFVY
ncbi:beta-carotene 15,15'-monooxygenase [Nautilia sp. PV-1]|nr:beta-carotene 15,15'-monooxygenase [Nautilia sp. PV-1]